MIKNINIELSNLEIYKKIVEHMNESLWIGDTNSNTIYINHIFCELTGYKTEEIIGKNYCIFWDKKSIEIIKNIKVNNKIKYEANLKTKNGEIIPVLCSGTKTEKGGIVLIISDLRELKTLKKAKEKLIKLNKTKDEFISIVGHELRTPLTSIRGYLSMILDGDLGKINNEIKNALNHSYNSSVRLIGIVNDVLSISKIESGKVNFQMEKINIYKLIESIKNDIDIEIQNHNMNLVIDFDESLKNKYIYADINKIKQVLLNLLTNAIKFNSRLGKIIFKITQINGNNFSNKQIVRFEIIDEGIGIEKEKINILFTKFSQIETSMQRHNTSGLGLGLAISQSFIKKFNSEIKIKSELGKGSNFYFDIELI